MSDDLTAIITFPGQAPLIYAMVGGKDWGNFHGAGFTQRNIQAVKPAGAPGALEVYFRPDADGSRVEVVAELGKLWGPANAAAAHLGPYNLQIRNSTSALLGTDAPAHWWFAKHRLATAPRPIITSPSQGIAAKLFPPLGRKNVPGIIAPFSLAPYAYARPMDLAGITAYMPQTGGRPDIGIVHEVFAYWMAHPDDPAAEAAARAVAEAAGSIPWHVRDETTGRPIDMLAHPSLHVWTHITDAFHSPDPDSFIANNSAQLIDAAGNNTSGVTIDVAHQPSLSYIMAIATGDRYHLESLQAQANACLTATAFWFKDGNAYLPRDEDRGYAWSLRTLFMARKATEWFETLGPLPPDILPSGYFKAILDNQLAQHKALFEANPTPAGTYYSAGPELISVPFWQNEFLGIAIQLGIWFGYEEWRPTGAWKLKGTINRVTSVPAYPCPYEAILCPSLFGIQCKGPDQPNPPQASDYSPKYLDVLDTMAANDSGSHGGQWQPGEIEALHKDPTNGGHLSPSQNPDYANNCRSHLAFAAANGFGEAVAPLALIDPYLADQEQTYRASFMPSIDGTIPTPPTTPPAKEIHMGKPFTLAVGQSIHLPLTWDDGAGNPAQAPTAIVYKADPPDEVELTPDDTGVTVKGLKGGSVIITVDAVGDGPLEDTDQGTVTLPLARAIHLNP